MTPVVIFHRLATVEYTVARRWYARRSRSVEAAFVAAVGAAVAGLAAAPMTGSPSVGAIRWVRVRRFPFLLHYQPISPTRIELFAVAHASRRPGYWLRRTRRP